MRATMVACAAVLLGASPAAPARWRLICRSANPAYGRSPFTWQRENAATADEILHRRRTDAELYQLGMNAAQGMCSRKDIQRTGDVVTLDSECKMGDMKMTSHAVMTFTGDTAYRTNIQSHSEPPMMGRSNSTMTQEAKWVGPCPAGMQPGDMVAPNGMKMNLKSTGKGQRAAAPLHWGGAGQTDLQWCLQFAI